jgi:hypothetical protein
MHYCKIEQCEAKQLSLGVSERSQNQRFFASHRVTSLTSHLFRFACTAAIAFAGSDRTEQTISGSLKQRGYLWQREWTPAVVDALGEVDRRMNGVVILGAEINLAGKKPEVARTTIDWDAAKVGNKHCALALRVAPFAGPFRSYDARGHAIVNVAKQLLSDAPQSRCEPGGVPIRFRLRAEKSRDL